MERIQIGTNIFNVVYHRNALTAKRASELYDSTRDLRPYELKELGLLDENGILDLTKECSRDSIPTPSIFVEDFRKRNLSYNVTYFPDENLITVQSF